MFKKKPSRSPGARLHWLLTVCVCVSAPPLFDPNENRIYKVNFVREILFNVNNLFLGGVEGCFGFFLRAVWGILEVLLWYFA